MHPAKAKTRLLFLHIRPLMEPALFLQGLSQISPIRARLAMRSNDMAARCRSLGASLLLARALADAGLPPKETKIAVTAYGKPFFPARPELHFSLAHCGQYAACALGFVPCGVDIEAIAPLEHRLGASSLHPQEKKFLARLSPGERPKFFAQLWTRKEALLKLLGLGLGIDPRRLSVLGQDPTDRGEKLPCHFQDYALPGHAACLCLPQTVPFPDMECPPLASLLK
jgi:phosphopantetheinyl transferase